MKTTSAASEEPRDRSAGVPPPVVGASRPRFGSVQIHDRGYIPHWEKESGTYFVAFRLADSLPRSVLERIESERKEILQTALQLHRPLSDAERKKLQTLSTPIIERYLDNGAGACYLQRPPLADVVADALRHFDEKRYRLFAWCVMPNHVHVVFKIFPGSTLNAILHSWKSYTARIACQSPGIHSPFWQREYYDHLIRDQVELERAIRYVALNPEKANLKHGRWVWVCGQDARTTAAADGGATLAQ